MQNEIKENSFEEIIISRRYKLMRFSLKLLASVHELKERIMIDNQCSNFLSLTSKNTTPKFASLI